MSKPNHWRQLRKGDRVQLSTWSPLSSSIDALIEARPGDVGTVLFANNSLSFGGSHAVKWDKGTFSGGVRGCWLNLLEKGTEMKEEEGTPVVEDLDEAKRRRELTGRIRVAEHARATATQDADRAYEDAVARAWELYDKGRP